MPIQEFRLKNLRPHSMADRKIEWIIDEFGVKKND